MNVGLQGADGRPRRILLGWLQNGCSSKGSGIQDAAENSLTLPRELSLAPSDGSMRQRYVPELQRLREGAPHTITAMAFPTGTAATPIKGVRGPQLEIWATIKFDEKDQSSVFGLSVLSGTVDGVPEHTDIGVDLSKQQVFIDRRQSSAKQTDVDVRAGPMPKTLAVQGELQLHVFIPDDHTILHTPLQSAIALPLADCCNLAWPRFTRRCMWITRSSLCSLRTKQRSPSGSTLAQQTPLASVCSNTPPATSKVATH